MTLLVWIFYLICLCFTLTILFEHLRVQLRFLSNEKDLVVWIGQFYSMFYFVKVSLQMIFIWGKVGAREWNLIISSVNGKEFGLVVVSPFWVPKMDNHFEIARMSSFQNCIVHIVLKANFWNIRGVWVASACALPVVDWFERTFRKRQIEIVINVKIAPFPAWRIRTHIFFQKLDSIGEGSRNSVRTMILAGIFFTQKGSLA